MAPVRVYSEGELRLQLDTLKINDRYTIVNPGGDKPPHHGGFHDVQALGGGGFGVVVRARDIAGLSRAIKFLLDSSALLDGSDQGTNLFVREIRLTNERPYKHIVSIIDYDTIAVGNRSISYYVSQYVDGLTLRGFERRLKPLRSKIVSNAELRLRLHDLMLTFIRDVLAGLAELDAAAVAHMDLKPHNILVFPVSKHSDGSISDEDLLNGLRGDELHSFIIDLGAGKPIRPRNHGRTTLRYTPYFFPPIKDELGFDEADGKIEYSALASYWRLIDLYCLGRSLETILLDRVRRRSERVRVTPELQLDEPEKEEFWRVIFGEDFAVVEAFIDRLLDLNGGFTSARNAAAAFATISLTSARGVYDSEYLIGRADSIHVPVGAANVDIPRGLSGVVLHPTLQRLRWVQQLAFVSEIYPDGNHSRFAHSLRCLEIAKRTVMALSRRSQFRSHFERGDVDALLIAALVHDVGQYHFAHSIEDLKKLGDLTNDSALAAIQHDQDLAQLACDRAVGDGRALADLIRDCGVDPADIYYIISKREKDRSARIPLNISRDIVSGVIDVDRLAYLVHDSERTGVPYGGAIDTDRIIDALTLRVDGNEIGLAVSEVGVSAVEVALAAVHWMYREVYWHSQNRAFMAAVKLVMMRLLRRGHLTFAAYFDETWGDTDLAALRSLKTRYDRFLSRDHAGRNPLANLAALQGLGYTEILAFGLTERNPEVYRRIVRGVTAERMEDLASLVAAFVSGDSSVQDGDVLVDIPLKRRLASPDEMSEDTHQERGARPSLWVERRGPLTKVSREWVDIGQYSPLAGALGRFEDHSSRKIRIFAADELVERWSVRTRYQIEDGLYEAVADFTHSW